MLNNLLELSYYISNNSFYAKKSEKNNTKRQKQNKNRIPDLQTENTKLKWGIGEEEVVGGGVMRLKARMKDVLLKETASEVSKQTGLSGGATGVQSARLPAAAQTALSAQRAYLTVVCPAGLLHPPGSAAHASEGGAFVFKFNTDAILRQYTRGS